MSEAIASRPRAPRVLLATVTCVLGCAAPADPEDVSETDGWDVARTCAAPPGLGRPEHVAEVVALIEALPKPVTLPCLLESLERPLALVAAVSPFSAQATTRIDSPRLFVFSADLVLSVVPSGDGRSLLEMGEYVGGGRTLKAELEFPITASIGAAGPFTHARFGESTSCALCHDLETYAGSVDGESTFTSLALAPEPDRIVPIGFVEQHARDCDPAEDPERCALMQAVFAHGEVVPTTFPLDTKICLSP